MQEDNQLVTAYTYLKSYARFQAKAGTGVDPLPPKVLDNGGPAKGPPEPLDEVKKPGAAPAQDPQDD